MNCRWIVMGLGLVCGGCSKPEQTSPTPATPGRPSATATNTAAPAGTPAATNGAAKVPLRSPVPNAGQLESDYLQAKDLLSKMSILDDITDAEPGDAVSVLSRLFFYEADDAVRQTILNQLAYVDGAEAAKVELLSEAVKPTQSRSIRLAAIDQMVDEGDPSGISVLQSYVNDSDAQVRQSAVDAIHDLQSPN